MSTAAATPRRTWVLLDTCVVRHFLQRSALSARFEELAALQNRFAFTLPPVVLTELLHDLLTGGIQWHEWSAGAPVLQRVMHPERPVLPEVRETFLVLDAGPDREVGSMWEKRFFRGLWQHLLKSTRMEDLTTPFPLDHPETGNRRMAWFSAERVEAVLVDLEEDLSDALESASTTKGKRQDLANKLVAQNIHELGSAEGESRRSYAHLYAKHVMDEKRASTGNAAKLRSRAVDLRIVRSVHGPVPLVTHDGVLGSNLKSAVAPHAENAMTLEAFLAKHAEEVQHA